MIGQQWLWTFRYPGYGGVETPYLVLPVGRSIDFHVTSLDVVHSFWAYELGVKADAIPGADNVAYVKPLKTGSFQIRCAELCGLWHGHMNTTGSVLEPGRRSRPGSRPAAAKVRRRDQGSAAVQPACTTPNR